MLRLLGSLQQPLLGVGERLLGGKRPPQPVVLPKGVGGSWKAGADSDHFTDIVGLRRHRRRRLRAAAL